MVSLEYANAYSEVLEILKYISKEDLSKIPKELVNVYEENSNKDYNFYYNSQKTLDEQNVLEETKIIIAILYRDYWATNEERMEIMKRQQNARQKIEEEKSKNYDIENIFENRNNFRENEVTLPVLIKKKKWYEKFVDFFKRFVK